ncbi:hypothetical protein EOA32_00975 [Mesorhizobium sp. M1A.F.Ca.ET.072.01.1.1]|uniref:hypothetical protein n=1 Tax=Mesorhizobium sp. M1A.F.Ca.ET.072.01.1.1 TaxID=2496753 RepID=UPI000FD51400|nr:hypothetical protein [Mesorhizobium sp. M1A.F.Ca.ET.072.01.1.1]RUW55622.1 hypothetical protein EOA32_00975 [Mesorhizobium sp. M1A.F.Ca.ET.072.01.1.1]
MTGELGFGLYNHTTPCLRIAYDPATNGATEDPANVGKFKFDSLRGTSLGYVYDIGEKGSYDSRYRSGGWNTNYWFFTTQGDFESPYTASNIGPTAKATIVWLTSGSGAQTKYFYKEWFPFGYMPHVEFRWIDESLPANTFVGAQVDYTSFASSNGFVDSSSGYLGTTIGQIDGNLFGSSGFREAYARNTKNNLGFTDPTRYLMTTFQLPRREDALPDFSTTPVSGQQVLLINPTTARLALPGRTVSDPNPDHYIFHEDKIPAKIMAAGDVTVPASGSIDIPCPLPITAFTYMDFMIKRQTDTEFWNPPFYDSIASDKSLQFRYFIDVANQKVTITNQKATALTLRYIIFADSDQIETTGGKKVLYNGNDGTTDFAQIKRPGSSDVAPNLNDIIVDTRLAYLPILAQGFLNWTADFPTVVASPNKFKGERMTTINVNNPSPALKLYVKQSIIFPESSHPIATRPDFHRVFTDAASWTGRASQDSSWAMVHADESAVDFYMAGSNPQTANNSGGTTKNQTWDGSNHDTDALGMRYYIFGIPQNL